jgi:hypothetical protein
LGLDDQELQPEARDHFHHGQHDREGDRDAVILDRNQVRDQQVAQQGQQGRDGVARENQKNGSKQGATSGPDEEGRVVSWIRRC